MHSLLSLVLTKSVEKGWNPRDVGVERDRKLQIPAFVWAFVFGFAAGESRILAGFRRSYNSTADETISPGGFYQGLTLSLAEYLRDLVERGLNEIAVPELSMLISTALGT